MSRRTQSPGLKTEGADGEAPRLIRKDLAAVTAWTMYNACIWHAIVSRTRSSSLKKSLEGRVSTTSFRVSRNRKNRRGRGADRRDQEPMGTKKNIDLELSDSERRLLRKHGIRKSDVHRHAADDLAALLRVPVTRAERIRALADFQRIPSIGVELAKDLIYLGYTSLEGLNGRSGAELTDQYERRKGYRTDPCVEDQFRLVVDFARNGDITKRWWDFTAERKSYRASVGYPDDRPEVSWTEVLRPKGGSG